MRLPGPKNPKNKQNLRPVAKVGLTTSVTRYDYTAVRFLPCAEPLRRVATTFPMPISAATLRWPNGFSGRYSSTCKSFLPDLPPDVEVKDWLDVFVVSFMWWTPAPSR